ncbi:MAG TPA: hypothetical protein VH144_02530 [Candidatus Saccharimonadales bacterium]|jgi:hypothetical protein|nr:hypothetical protein [Candidatus Saccharimonadales bacterium]
MERAPENLSEPPEKPSPEKSLLYYSTWQVRCGNCLLVRAADTVFTCVCPNPTCKQEWNYYAGEDGRENRVARLGLTEIPIASLALAVQSEQEPRRIHWRSARTTKSIIPSPDFL